MMKPPMLPRLCRTAFVSAGPLALLLSLCVEAGSIWADPLPVPGAPLSGEEDWRESVQAYLDTADPEKADALLAKIMAHPHATVPAVQELLRRGKSFGQEPVGEQPHVPLTVQGRARSYALSVPTTYEPAQAYPLVICLHGAGFTGEAYLERWQGRLGERYILACPTSAQGAWWTRAGEELVLATIHDVQVRYHIDPDRIFLTGMSNGGIGAYLIGAEHATLFAGVAPMAGGLDDVLLPLLHNFLNTPLYIIHGRQDQVMPVELSRSIDRELTRLGVVHHYREHDRTHPMAGGHFFPREEVPALVEWFDRQRRRAVPAQVRVVRDATHLTPFAWVRIDATDRIAAFSPNLVDERDEALVQKRYATVEAAVAGSNRIDVKTQWVRRYSLLLNDELVDFAKPVTVTTNGTVSFSGLVTPSVAHLLRDARQRRDPRALYPGLVTIAVETNP